MLIHLASVKQIDLVRFQLSQFVIDMHKITARMQEMHSLSTRVTFHNNEITQSSCAPATCALKHPHLPWHTLTPHLKCAVSKQFSREKAAPSKNQMSTFDIILEQGLVDMCN